MKTMRTPVRTPSVQRGLATKRSPVKREHLMLLFTCCVLFFCSPTHAQIVSTIAGNGTSAYTGDGGPATAAEVEDEPHTVAILSSGDMLISDHNCIRKINTSGVISRYAGTGVSGNTGDNGPATAATFYTPQSIALDASGNIYFVSDNVIRKINTSGTITTVAGNGTAGFSGDNGPATAAELNAPEYVTIDGSGNLLISDYWNFRIRKVNTSGTITTIAGNGTNGFSGMGGPATAAEIGGSWGMVTDASGNIIFADPNNYRILKIDASGNISSIAGTGTIGYSGDGGPATAAEFFTPNGVALDACGNIYFSDAPHGNIRRIDLNGIITTAAGLSTDGYNGDGYVATATQFNAPQYIAFDASGNLIVPDAQNYRYRKIASLGPTSPQTPPTAAPTNNSPVCSGSSVTLTANATNTTSYLWSGPSLSTATTANTSATPTTTSTYSLTVTNGACSARFTTTVTVDPSPAPISGPSTVCTGSSITLTDGTAGGTWSSSNPAIGAISAGGVLTGVSAGTLTITYTTSGMCTATTGITVNALPAVIAGPPEYASVPPWHCQTPPRAAHGAAATPQ